MVSIVHSGCGAPLSPDICTDCIGSMRCQCDFVACTRHAAHLCTSHVLFRPFKLALANSDAFAGVADRLIVSLGCDMLKVIPGRISTEVDAHLSYDTQGTVEKAHRIVDLYKEHGVSTVRAHMLVLWHHSA